MNTNEIQNKIVLECEPSDDPKGVSKLDFAVLQVSRKKD